MQFFVNEKSFHALKLGLGFKTPEDFVTGGDDDEFKAALDAPVILVKFDFRVRVLMIFGVVVEVVADIDVDGITVSFLTLFVRSCLFCCF